MNVRNSLATNITAVSNVEKYKDIGTSKTHPIRTRNGVTNNEIWIEEPTATPTARSILFFTATTTAVTCSAALPTIGITIKPIKVFERPELSTISSIDDTR
ncbi:hypothetical protein OGAPHI_005065 [Ogataea philodendri]|uniref:Uncharacterized protein n=1 Tax=Ogataea philodendri TaxID=1378263 RepID=A0A9P8T2Y9_9ASCO|nr:uncharacterized protein OGAPHI_005065 [Ogataea philodendri]KAH3663664.1 hypothetical protein OGAPHI_005065 [Ogataea philodendri]